MIRFNQIICGAALPLLLALPSLASESFGPGAARPAGARPDPVKIERITEDCTLITFEGLGDDVPIPVIVGDVTVTFGPSWHSIIDSDAGGTGNFANEPSPDTAAYYVDDLDRAFHVSPPVQFIGFFYSAAYRSLPVTLTAYGAEGQVIDTVVGATLGSQLGGADCTGDPTGNFCLWDAITLNAAADDIVRVEIVGSSPGYIGFDNLRVCREAQEVGACCLPAGTCSVVSEANCLAAEGVFYPNLSCDDIPCGYVPTERSSWSLIKASYR